jgi:glycosyltransferase involved in cell wall biosynthesis
MSPGAIPRHSRETSPLVSVVVPAYNRERFIARTVDSVLAQRWPAVELIVVDDGSTDGTREILEGYARDGSLQLLEHPGRANRGQSAALNLGLSVARGDYISLLDSDDAFLPRKFEVLVPYLEAHPDVGLVYSNGYAVDADDRILYPMHSDDHEEPNDPAAVLLDCYLLLPQNAVVRRSVFDRAGRFEEGFRSAQDHDMLIRLAEITRFAYVPEFLFHYRRHDDSISAKSQHVRWHTGFEILRRAAQRYPYDASTLRRRRAVLHFRMGQVHRRERPLAAVRHYASAGLLDPRRATRVLLGRERSR